MLIDVELVHMTLNLLHVHVYDCGLPLYVTISVSCYIVGVGNYSKSSWKVNHFIVLVPVTLSCAVTLSHFQTRYIKDWLNSKKNNFGLQKLHCSDDLSFKLKQNRSQCFSFRGDLTLKFLRFGVGLRS